MKKIYLVSYYFAPLGRADGVNRTYLVKYLSEIGWDIDIITGEKYRSLVLNFQQDRSLLDALPQAVNIQRFESHKGWIRHDLKKVLKIENNLRLPWMNNVLNNVDIANRGVMFAIVPPSDNAVIAYELAREHNCPLVLYYGDDVVDIDRKIIKRADLIIAVTPQIKKVLYDYYGHENIMVFENGYADEVSLEGKREVDFPIKIAYAGSLNFRTRPEIFARACKKLIEQDPGAAEKLKVDFFGPKGYYSALFLKRYLCDSIQFKGYLPFNELMKTLPQYDMALASTKGDISFTSKVYHYLNAGLPIFSIFENRHLGEFVLKNKIGIVSSLKDDDIIAQLKELFAHKESILGWRDNVLKIRAQYALKGHTSKISSVLTALPSCKE